MLALEVFDAPRPTITRLLDRCLDLPHGARVLIKPDWNARSEPRPGENTTAAFLGALLEWLHANGAASVTVGHASLLTPPDIPYTSFTDLLKIADCNELLEEFPHLRLVDLEVEPMERRGGFLVPRCLRDFDVMISCVRMKTHMGTQIAGAAKGLMGLLPDSEHLRMHREGLAAGLAGLAEAIQPTITLVEADVAMEGNGPHHGDAVPMGLYLAGDQLLELDAAMAQLMGINPAEVGYLAASGGPSSELPVEWRAHARDFARPSGVLQVTRAARVYPGDSCGTCHVAANSVLDFARDNPTKVRELAGLAKALYVDGVELYMGHQAADASPSSGRCVAVGDCAERFAKQHGVPHIPGCPVRYESVQPALIELMRRTSS